MIVKLETVESSKQLYFMKDCILGDVESSKLWNLAAPLVWPTTRRMATTSCSGAGCSAGPTAGRRAKQILVQVKK
jgi:hypothetical protein